MHRILIFLLLTAIAAGCSEYNKVLKSSDLNYKFEKAVEFYEDDKCYQALPVLEELISLTRGTNRAEDVYYYHARSHYCVEDYYLANYYLTNFTKNFSYSERAEECQFLAAMCSYHLSPEYSLDQTETTLAINELQLFLDRYPASELRDSCETMIEELSAKLERKSYEVAKLYAKTEQYKSAVIALEYGLRDFPNSIYREEMMFLMIRSSFLYSDQSVEEKKLERFNDCIEHYLNFVAYFPESKYLRQAENFLEKSEREVARLKAENNL